MRLLLIHSDNIEYKAQKKTPVAEEDIVEEDGMQEALTAFCAVEKIDEDDIEGVSSKTAADILETAKKLAVSNIMIYPYAHLIARKGRGVLKDHRG